MRKRVWKHARARSIGHAMELCLEYAREKHNLSVDRVADRMGLANKWNIYKWMENGRLPALLIRPFEVACDCPQSFVTNYLAGSAHKLVIDIPTGRKCSQDDLLKIQTEFNEAVNLLAEFYKSAANTDETIGALTTVMQELAGQRENVSKTSNPELDLFPEK